MLTGGYRYAQGLSEVFDGIAELEILNRLSVNGDRCNVEVARIEDDTGTARLDVHGAGSGTLQDLAFEVDREVEAQVGHPAESGCAKVCGS